MSFAAKANMISRYTEETLVQLTDDTGFGQIDDAVLNAALAYGNARVTAALEQGGHTLPLSSVDPILIAHAQAIARWHLSKHARPEIVTQDYNAAIKDLMLVAERKLLPPVIDEVRQGSIASNTRTMRFDDDAVTSYQGMRSWQA